MRRLILPLLLVVAAVGAFRYSEQRGERDVTAVATADLSSPTTPLLSARRLPELLDQPRALSEIERRLQEVALLSPPLSCLVAHGDDGVELLAHNAEVGLAPASVQKLVTASAVLRQFGPDARLRTVLAATAAPAGGVVDGNLYLIGGGDPLLHTDDYAATAATSYPHSRLEELADALVAVGVTQINGGIIGHAGRYDSEAQPGSWDPEGNLAQSGRTGPLSALMVNDGFAEFPATIEPDVFGTPAENSAIQAAAIFDDLLEARGVVVGGGAGVEPELPEGIVEVTALESLPMSDIVAEMLTFSDNTTAELLLKELGMVTAGEGTTDAGALAALETLGSQGIDVSTMRVADGSGLSPRNRLSCRSVIQILDEAGLDSMLGQGLAIGGRTGTLRDRYLQPPLRNVVHAKTGSLLNVSALAGFIETRPGGVASFAYIINLEPEIPESLRPLQDQVLSRLVEYPTGPPLENLVPLAPDRDPAAPYDSTTAGGEGTEGNQTDEGVAPEPTPGDGETDPGGGLGPDE